MFAQAERRVGALAAAQRSRENFEGALIPALLDELPAGHRFFCGNSLPIRDLDAFSGSGDKPLRFFANRGASGIDGNLSTALGIASEGPCVALLGDLTVQHDLTALA
ncbi:MAG: 2-succinyl-5-enolpyruvyl-6-hydroxy-3-cyclohexene-1-carboxylate synthase [Candidatus Accumulibacter sp. BA-94]|nr:MAG: 2-succinyl-5-enolpyruvyl-6-hydroxy-3-cyclohexene-1-carboxylate synthase [Candidatus Accumulibacter sp. BA-94]